MLKLLLAAGMGGFVGTLIRYLCGKLLRSAAPASFPWSTFIVNAAGCLLIGIFYGMAERHNLLSPTAKVFLITGLCGGLTTFSTFADDLWLQIDGRAYLHFAAYLVASLAVGLAMVWLGRSIVR